MAVDGHLNFDTKIDTKGFNSGISLIKKTTNGIASIFGKINDTIKRAFDSKIINTFGKKTIETAASVNAEVSQMNQTFGSMKDAAVSAMKSVADQSGIMQTRLQSAGTSLYVFARTAGMEQAEAIDMMSEALQVAADSAAYYDQSLEDVTETLKSYLKGNYENDAALGLTSTETTRNAKAMQLYGKSFIELSEAQKQLALLDMVKDANKASGALGQAARESEGWENVLGNLKESWRQFVAVMGQPLLQIGIPAIQTVTSAVQSLTEKVQATSSNGSASALTPVNSNIDTSAETEKLEQYQKAFENLQVVLKPVTDSLEILWGKLKKLSEPFGEGLSYFKDTILIPLGDWFLQNLLPTSIDLIGTALDTFGVIINKISPYVTGFLENVLVPLGEWAGDAFIGTLERVIEKLEDFQKLVRGKITLGEFLSDLSLLETILLAIAVAITGVEVAISIFNAITTAVAGVKAMFSLLTSPIGLVTIAIVALVAGIILCIQHWDEIKAAAGRAWDFITEKFSLLADWFYEHVIEPVGDFFAKLWQGIKNGFINFVNFIIDGINALIRGFLSPINTLIAGWNGSIGLIAGEIPEISIEIPKIPKLATGTVIPPNREFLAILGDQKQGVNIETPLDTMLQAFKQALSEGGYGQNQTVVLELDGRELGRTIVRLGKQENNRVGSKLRTT